MSESSILMTWTRDNLISDVLREWLASRIEKISVSCAEDIRTQGWDRVNDGSSPSSWLCGETIVEDESHDGVLVLRVVLDDGSGYLVVTENKVVEERHNG